MPLTQLLNLWQDQGKHLDSEHFSNIYLELKRLAKAAMARERSNHTLQATELVNEVYLLMDKQKLPEWENRLHFFSVISLMMRRIMVDHARKKNRLKRGKAHLHVTLSEECAQASGQPLDILEVHRALEDLFELDRRHGLIVELKLFGGFTNEEVGEIMGLSSRTIKRDWQIAKGWLKHRLATPAMVSD